MDLEQMLAVEEATDHLADLLSDDLTDEGYEYVRSEIAMAVTDAQQLVHGARRLA